MKQLHHVAGQNKTKTKTKHGSYFLSHARKERSLAVPEPLYAVERLLLEEHFGQTHLHSHVAAQRHELVVCGGLGRSLSHLLHDGHNQRLAHCSFRLLVDLSSVLTNKKYGAREIMRDFNATRSQKCVARVRPTQASNRPHVSWPDKIALCGLG